VESAAWIALDGERVVAGGFASESRGHVTSRSPANGSVLWRTFFDPVRGPVHGTVNAAGSSRYGLLDGATIVTTSDDGTVKTLDSATGAVQWSTEIEPTDQPVTMRRSSGPVVVVPRAGSEPVIVTAQFVTGQPMRANSFVLGVDGRLLGTTPLLREARDIAIGDTGGGRPVAAIAAGLSLTAITP
jgi:outer membrane protein assembly factor BamB